MNISKDEIVKNLEKIREIQGEAAYQMALRNLAAMLRNDPRGEAFMRDAFPNFDMSSVPEQTWMPADLLTLMQMMVPNLKTQIQFDLFNSAFLAFTTTLNAYYGGQPDVAQKSREALNIALDTASRLHRVTEQVSELPPEALSGNAKDFVNPPKQFTEIEEQRRLLAELNALTTSAALSDWYKSERPRIDRIVSTRYRDPLFDAIRKKSSRFGN